MAKDGTNRGRKKGTVTTKLAPLTRVRAHEIARSGNAPLDIMLGNMMFWHQHAESMGQKIETLIDDVADLPVDARGEELEKLKPLLKQFLLARENSQACAVDAAPYVHPRLASIAFKRPGEKKVVITAALPEPRGDNEDRAYREGYEGDNITTFPVKKIAGGT